MPSLNTTITFVYQINIQFMQCDIIACVMLGAFTEQETSQGTISGMMGADI